MLTRGSRLGLAGRWRLTPLAVCGYAYTRFSAPRFQIFVNNRLSTTNMTLAIDENLQVDSVDTFLILRCPDAVRVDALSLFLLDLCGECKQH